MPNHVQMTEAEIFTHLENAATSLLLTSTPRAARTLRNHYSNWQQQNKKTGWRTPRILNWDAWLAEMWDGLIMAGAVHQGLLTSAQERALWLEAIRARAEGEGAAWGADSTATAFAELAQSSYERMEDYCISPTELEQAASGRDAQTFGAWTRRFQAKCKRQAFVAPAELVRLLCEQLKGESSQAIPQPQEIFLVGFDRVTPRQQELIASLREKNCVCEFLWLTPEEVPGIAPVIVAARDANEELQIAAEWIRERLLKHPQEKIGVLAPSITDSRDAVDRIFRSVLAPSALRLGMDEPRLPYEFSLGVAMHQIPQVRAALLLLRWLQQPIAWEDVSFLLTSGHIGTGQGDNDAHAANSHADGARLDAAIRKDPQAIGAEVGFGWPQNRLRQKDVAHLTRLHESMSAVAALAQEMFGFENTLRTYADWREKVDQLLRAARWTLFQAKTSAEFQLLARWEHMLDELSALDAVSERVSFSMMLATLADATRRTLYTLETQNAPVQVLGIPESAGLTFDAVWFLNASASAWPPQGRAQAWIPWPLQRHRAMPYADVEADTAYARMTTERILAGSKETIFSFPLEEDAQESGGRRTAKMEVRVSPILLELLPETSITKVEARAKRPAAEETVEVQRELAVELTHTKVRHGVRFLKQQAACPFQAFAELRLNAAALEDPTLGLAPKDQGSALHDVLRIFWTEVKDQQTLRGLGEERRRVKVQDCIQQALRALPACSAMEKALLATEAERLCERVLAWLQVEEQRPDFSVEACEQTILNATIGGLQADCRMDRIDRVGSADSSGLALMDYKTGVTDAKACDGERPDEPQLAAYAVLMRENFSTERPLRGVALASLQAKKMEFKIIHSLPQTFTTSDPKNSKSRTPILTAEELERQVDAWDATLGRLAGDFQAGLATVDPKKPVETCRYCAQGIFCRVKEAQGLADESDDENSESEGDEQ